MTTKKAIIIGTLCAIGVTLTAYAIKKGIEINPKTMTAVNANDFEYTPKNQIITEYTSNGYNYDVEPNYTNGQTDSTYQNNPQTFTQTLRITNLTNTTWLFNTTLTGNTPTGRNIATATTAFTETYTITNTIANSTTTTIEFKSQYTNGQYIKFVMFGSTIRYNYNNNTWLQTNNLNISITGGINQTSTDLINWFYENATLTSTPPTETFLANRKTEKETNTANSITYTIENQKTFHNGTTKSEGLVQLKIYSQGTTESLYLTDAYFRSAIPRFSELGEMWAKFKIAKIDTIQSMTGSNYNEYDSYENFYNNLTGKTNIYSTDWYWNKATQGGTADIKGTYSNETGTRIVHMSDGSFAETSGYSWQITEQEINIKLHQKTNYVVIYYSFEVTGTPSYQDYATALNTRIGIASGIKGYSIATTIVAPPDIEDGNFMSLTGMILNILTLPFTFLSQAFNLTLWADTPWAFNIKNAIFVMIGIMTFLFIIKLFTRGFDSLGNFSDGWQRHKLTKEQRKLTKANRQKAEKKVNKDK